MAKNSNRRLPRLRLVAAAGLGAAALITAAIALHTSRSASQAPPRPFAFKNGDCDAGGHTRALAAANDSRWPDYTADVEAYLLRAYPASEVPGEATLAAHRGWAELNASAHSSGVWQLIGPSKATYPSVLNPFLFDGAQYVTAVA